MNMKQMPFHSPFWGGRRARSGRKPKGDRAGVRHSTRPRLWRLPLHVNWRMRKHVWNLRSRRCFRRIEEAFWAACDRFGMRITHFSVQGNHIHLIVEADDHECLSRAMQGLGVRIAKKLNRVMSRSGSVLADRYFARALKSPQQVRSAVEYVLRNHLKHLDTAEIIDQYASDSYRAGEAPVVPPMTKVMRRGLGLPDG
jgi:REP element-mobilizing transposase RayT